LHISDNERNITPHAMRGHKPFVILTNQDKTTNAVVRFLMGFFSIYFARLDP
jgi:hypothetical protein